MNKKQKRKIKIGFFLDSLNRVTGGHKRRVYMANELKSRGYDVALLLKNNHFNKIWTGVIKVRGDVNPWDKDYDFLFLGDARFSIDPFLKSNNSTRIWMMQGAYEGDNLLGGKLFQTVNNRIYRNEKIIKLAFTTYMRDWLRIHHKATSILAPGGINTAYYYPQEFIQRETKICSVRWHVPGEWKHEIDETVRGSNWSYKETVGREREEDMANFYRSAGILVTFRAPSVAGVVRDWNNPMAEAMACKTPVITTPMGGIRDIAIQGKTAYIVESKEEFRRVLKKCINSRTYKNQHVERAYAHIKGFEYFDMIDIVEKEIIQK